MCFCLKWLRKMVIRLGDLLSEIFQKFEKGPGLAELYTCQCERSSGGHRSASSMSRLGATAAQAVTLGLCFVSSFLRHDLEE